MALADHYSGKSVLDRDEMTDVLVRRVRAIYGLSVDEYCAARVAGKLPYKPEGAWLKVFVGEKTCAQSRRS